MSWPMVKLKDVSQLIDYGLTASADVDCDGPLFLRITDLGDDGVNWSKVPRCVCDDKQKQKNLLEKGDIVFARTGATTGKSYLISEVGEDTVFASYLIRVRPTKEVHSPFLAYFFKSPNYWYQIGGMSSGATLPGVNASKLSELEIPLPPLDEQKRIAAILDKADAIRQKRKQAIALADEFLRSVFLEMFGDPVTNPKGWEVKAFGELGVWASGGTPSRNIAEYFEGEIDWYSARELNHRYLNGSVEKITEDALKNSAAKVFPAGSMLVGMYDTAALKISILKKDAASNQACANIIPNELVNIEWLYSYIEFSKDTYLRQRRGVRQKNLNLGMIKDFKLPLPPVEEQLKYVTLVKKVIAIKENSSEYSELTVSSFDSLSQKAFSGQL